MDATEAHPGVMDDVSKARATVRREPPERPAQLTRFMTHLLDDAVGVPGTNFRFGLDPVLSLVPGLGSSVGTTWLALWLGSVE